DLVDFGVVLRFPDDEVRGIAMGFTVWSGVYQCFWLAGVVQHIVVTVQTQQETALSERFVLHNASGFVGDDAAQIAVDGSHAPHIVTRWSSFQSHGIAPFSGW